MARGLASRRTRTIGVLLNDLRNPFFAEMMDGLFEAADELDYRLLIGTGRRQVAGERRPLRDAHVDSVTDDDVAGAKLAVRHLAELGHSRIAHIDGGRGAGAAARRRGYVREMERLGLEPHVVPGEFTDAAGVRAAERLLDGDALPTAVFAANDLVAAGALDRFEDSGLQVPRDISIIGYDNTFLAALHHMSLTTIDQPRPEIGRLALMTLVERIDGVRADAVHHRVEPSLVVRGTTGPPPG
jgi:DNA-binding LacI/PurR family transcriptional regulator